MRYHILTILQAKYVFILISVMIKTVEHHCYIFGMSFLHVCSIGTNLEDFADFYQ